MDHRTIDALMAGIAPVIRDAIAAAQKAMLERIAALEARPITTSVNADDVARLLVPVMESAVAARVKETIELLPAPAPGKDADMDALVLRIDEQVAARVAEIPAPKDGESVTLDQVRPLLEELVAALPPPQPGKDADPAEVIRQVDEVVARAVAALPPAKDGSSVTVDDVRPLLAEMVAAIPAAKDGVGVAGALIDRDGNLVLTLSDGSTRNLDRVVGADVDMDQVVKRIDEAVAAIPRPRDAFGFDDLHVEHDGERTTKLVFARGEERKEFDIVWPVPIDRGVWREGRYQRGDSVSFGGSSWIARKDTETKPDTPDSDWRLAVKRGRDGGSAYDVARRAGFRGTESDWLETLRAKPPAPVKLKG